LDIEFALEQDEQHTGSALLIALLQWCDQHDVWQAFQRHLKVKMKTVIYSPVQKLQTVCASIFAGCQHNKDINARLVPDVLAAGLLNMARFPDQSQINLALRALDELNLAQLEQVHADLLTQFAPSLDRPATGELLVVDIDQCGLVANGKSYELACKGYFANQYHAQGYQLSAAFVAGAQLTLALRLDPGNVECKARFQELVALSRARLPQAAANGQLLMRADAGYGTSIYLQWLQEQAQLFLIKKLTNKPSAWVRRVEQADWQPVAGCDDVKVAEISPRLGVRYIVCAMTTAEQEVEYSVLATNLPVEQYSGSDLWWLYSKRQNIEAFFKLARNTYGMSNLRSREYKAIHGFLWLLFISHNLLKWAQAGLFGSEPLAKVGIRELVTKLGRVCARRERSASGWRVWLSGLDSLARRLAAALQPMWLQLDLGLDDPRLYET
jgi:hypothetical protein